MRDISKSQDIWSAYLSRKVQKYLEQKDKLVKITHSAVLVLNYCLTSSALLVEHILKEYFVHRL